MTTDQEQDILRAMLVMACAGLDAGLKQIIRDALPLLVQRNPDAQSALERFVARRVRGAESDFGTDTKYLAKILASSSPYASILDSYVDALTGDSLQSTDQLMKAINALGLDPKTLGIDKEALGPVFKTRNQIIHELDIDLEGEQRKRIIRRMEDMIGWTNRVLELTKAIIEAVGKRLSQNLPEQ